MSDVNCATSLKGVIVFIYVFWEFLNEYFIYMIYPSLSYFQLLSYNPSLLPKFVTSFSDYIVDFIKLFIILP